MDALGSPRGSGHPRTFDLARLAPSPDPDDRSVAAGLDLCGLSSPSGPAGSARLASPGLVAADGRAGAGLLTAREVRGRTEPRGASGTAESGPSDDQVFRQLLENRIVFLGTVVEDAMANAICAKLLLLSAADPKSDIHLYINSPGGSVSAGMAIYDTMQFIPNDVATVALGFAGSMGQFLLTAGTAGKRYALPHSRIMMHQPSGGIGGTATDIAIQAEQLLFTKRLIQERIAEHSGQSVAQIEADSDRDRWFTAEEARDYGLVDRVIARADQVSDAGGTPALVGSAGRAGRAGFRPAGTHLAESQLATSRTAPSQPTGSRHQEGDVR